MSYGALSTSAVVVALVCALILRFAGGWMAMQIPFGFVWVLAAAVPLLNYFFEILEHRALGKGGWPVLSVDTLFTFRRQLSFVCFVIAIGVAFIRAMLVAADLDALGDLFVMFVVFVVPVSVAVLAVTRRLSKSINPVFLIHTIVRLELGYIFILALSAAWWLIARRAWSNGSFLLIFAATVTLLMLGWAIGSIVFRWRRRLGLESAWAPEARLAAEQAQLHRQREDVLSTAWGFASRGNVSGALRIVREYVAEEADPLEAESWMFHRMARWQEPAAAMQLGSALSRQLSDAGRERDAAKVEVVCETLRTAQRRNTM